jgi:hypothetical protein
MSIKTEQVSLPFDKKVDGVDCKVYPVLDDKDKHVFSVKVFGNPEYRMKFEIWEKAIIKSIVIANGAGGSVKHFLYAKGEIAWDGQSQITFSENGKLILSGAKEWAMHCSLMVLLYRLAAKLILAYNPTFGGDLSQGIKSLKIMNPIEGGHE